MNVVGRVGTLISQGVYSVVTPFHPFGGAVDIIAVEQQDGTFRSTPWYVRFGKFQGVLKGAEKMVRISVNGVEANFHMYLDNSGEAYFTREVESSNDEGSNHDLKYANTSAKAENEDVMIENSTENDDFDSQDVDTSSMYHALSVSQNSSSEFHDNESQPSPSGSPHYGTYRYESLGHVEDLVNSQGTDSEVVLVSGDGHVLLAPISSADDNTDNLQLNTPHFELYPGEGEEEDIEQLENSSKFGRNGVHMKLDGQVQDAGVHSDDAGPSSIIVDGDDSVSVSNISYTSGKVKPFSQGKDGDDSSVHSSVHDVEPSMNRSEVFKSCLEFSELTSELEADNAQKDDVSSVGLEPEGRILDEQGQFESSFMTRDRMQEGSPLEVETSLCVSVSCTSSYAIEQTGDLNSEENALVDRKTYHAELQNVSIINDHDELDHVDESLQPSVGCQEPEHFEPQERDDSQLGVSRMSGLGFEISLCGNILRAGMGVDYAKQAFNAHIITEEEFKASRTAIMKNENLIVRYRDRYFSWDKAASIILGMAVFGLDLIPEVEDAIPVEQDDKEKIIDNNSVLSSTPSSRWRLWPNPFRRTKPLQHTSSSTSNEDDFVDSESFSPCLDTGPADAKPPTKQIVRTNLPTSEQIASLNLRDGPNKIAFIFSTRVLGEQQVDAHIYLWKWNARIVISDVDGTITRSDVLGQFMPLLGKDWSQLGVARLFSAIKENGYQLLFLSARAIVQAYLTRNFLLNLKQDGEALPNGPVVISPDGLFPSLYREVIRRRPHEFKIACLQDIRALFPSDYNPFYAGFGNRETDEISYRKIGIPKGKIFIINPKGEVAIHRCIDAKSYTSLHTLVNDMFPPTSLLEQEDYNSWNFWKVPLPNID